MTQDNQQPASNNPEKPLDTSQNHESAPTSEQTQPSAATPAQAATPAPPSPQAATAPVKHQAHTSAPDPKSANDGNTEPAEIIINENSFAMWGAVLAIYLLILIGIGYISFWEQDFNDPENTIGTYLRMLDSKHEADGSISDYSDEVKAMIESDFKAVIQEEMKNDADAAGDLQQLASQSFNIVLGAVLAFLSATSTMVFQKLSDAPSGKSAPPAKPQNRDQTQATNTSNQGNKKAGKPK